ncbi:peptide ABC transporter substrate-binding protein [Thermoflavimicrobium daqui]|uniref:Peptide ABC transporter substrate-binding protein n=1 Tax=Thermoflavimicrobium daqui TaxID=2137476 RepID=A0A364K9M9_9BACL|nr:peptide ABC transporter substrate-binding protein [Thermoflavimicrobium daqui]RAL26994.1 peptide ABC transporter substrate-binding protein [Thermoflavimicrobium daqui]
MRKKLALSLGLLLASSSVLAACGGGGGGNTANEKPQDTKTLEWYMGEDPKTLDYALDVDQSMNYLISNSMDGLFRLDADHKPQPAIAEGQPQISSDKKTYTFKLRDAKWSDGKPVTAKDFEFAWKRVVDPKTASQYANIMFFIENAQEINQGKKPADTLGVKAKDDKTLEVKLKNPTPFFLDLVAFATYLPQREDIVKKHGKAYGVTPDKLVYNGPFEISTESKKGKFVLKKNQNYWDKDKVKLEKVNLHSIEDDATAVKLYETGKLAWSGPLSGAFLTKYKNHKDKFVPPYASSWVLIQNFKAKDPNKAKFFGNKKIREAIDLSVDRNTLVDKVLRTGRPSGSWVPKEITVTSGKSIREESKLDPTKPDPAKAKQLLQEGLKEAGLSSAPTLEILVNNIDPNPQIAQYIKEELRKNLGLNTVVKSVPFKQRLELSDRGEFDLVLYGWGPDYNDPMTYMEFWTSDSPNNKGKWSNAEYDKLIEKSYSNTNFEERSKDLMKAEKIWVDDHATVPLYQSDRLYLVKPYVKGVKWHFFNADFDLKEAYIESK